MDKHKTIDRVKQRKVALGRIREAIDAWKIGAISDNVTLQVIDEIMSPVKMSSPDVEWAKACIDAIKT